MFDALAPAQLVENLLLFRVELRRNDEGDGLANRLVGLVAEDACGAAVPGEDLALEGLADYRIVRRVDDGGEQCTLVEIGVLCRCFWRRCWRRLVHKIAHFGARLTPMRLEGSIDFHLASSTASEVLGKR